MLFTIEIIHGDIFKNAFNVFSGKLSVAVLGVKSSKGGQVICHLCKLVDSN